MLFDAIRASKEVVRCSFHEGEPAFAAQIGLVHTPEYVRAILTGEPRALAESQEFQWSEKFACSVLAVNGGHLLACRLALEEGLSFHLASGGHHAHAGHGSGYCTFNYLAWCPMALMNEGLIQRVLIVDLDTHQGDGNWTLTRTDRRFRCFDISGCSMGVPPHHGEDGDYWLIRGRDSFGAKYMGCLAKLSEVMDRFRPDLVEYQAGMDVWESDPMMGGVGLSSAEIRKRDREVIGLCVRKKVPVVVNLAGGYSEMGVTVRLHFGTFLACMNGMSALRYGS